MKRFPGARWSWLSPRGGASEGHRTQPELFDMRFRKGLGGKLKSFRLRHRPIHSYPLRGAKTKYPRGLASIGASSHPDASGQSVRIDVKKNFSKAIFARHGRAELRPVNCARASFSSLSGRMQGCGATPILSAVRQFFLNLRTLT